jgi:hypothetical protein
LYRTAPLDGAVMAPATANIPVHRVTQVFDMIIYWYAPLKMD